MKKLEIYGTLGPSCCKKEKIKQMMKAGMSGMRLNLSHLDLWDHEDWLYAFYQASLELNRPFDLLIDMQGPELRVLKLKEDIKLKENEEVLLNSSHVPMIVLENTEINDIILLDDGKLKLIVKEINDNSMKCQVIRGGILQSHKSIYVEGKNIKGDILTKKDIENLKQAKKYHVTKIMQPFVSDKDDLKYVRNILNQLKLNDLQLYAKIENRQGFDQLENLMPYCDHIVVARGDLANSVGLVELPIIQKQIEKICHQHHKPYMIVTEMLNSMIENEIPTRAEVNDVFHAVYHGASSIMLTAETAKGHYPVESMKYFVEVAKKALEYKELTDKNI